MSAVPETDERGDSGTRPAPSDSPSPPATTVLDDRGSGAIRELDGARAIAALSVFVFHATLSAFGVNEHIFRVTNILNIGVSIFFVLSGFLIYRPFARANIGHRPFPSIWRYVVRRLLRIYPAYVAAIFIMWRLRLIDIVGITGFFRQASLMTDYWRPGARGGLGLDVAWTLQIEVSFYVIAPLLGLTLRWLGHGLRKLTGGRVNQFGTEIVATVALVAAGVWAAAWRLPQNVNIDDLLQPWMGELGGGMALAVLVSAAPAHRSAEVMKSRLGQIPTFVWWLGCAGLMAFLALKTTHSWQCAYCATAHQLDLRSYASVPTALLFVAPLVLGPQGHGPIRRTLASRPLVALGLASYSFYLWHEPIIVNLPTRWFTTMSFAKSSAAIALSFVIAVPVAATSYFLLERPFNRLGHRIASLRLPRPRG